MRSSRLLAILILLQLRTRLTAHMLADEFEVSIRTIYRDIDALSAAGIPIYGERGHNGGFQLLDGYRTSLTGLATDEAEAFGMIGMPGPAAALGLGAAAARAERKLAAAIGPRLGGQLGRISERFHLDPLDWYRDAEPVPHLPALTRALLDQQRVAFTYSSWKAVRDWQVEPLGLVLKGGAWYLVAQARGKSRTFKVANISAHQLLESRFERPDFDLAQHWQCETERFEKELRSETAILEASPLGLKRIAELGAYAARAVTEARGTPWARLNFPYENLEQAALLLMGIGPEVEVIAPHALRARVAALANQLAARHAC